MKPSDFKNIIIFENDDYIFINKPPDIASLNERLGVAMSVLQLAKAYCADAQLCHRIDKETSGVLAIAKHNEAYRNLALQFEHREVIKRYHAFVEGTHDFKDEIVDMPLGITSKGLAKIDFGEGKEAVTVVNTLKAFRHYTLAECSPVTGRLHQIRIHMAYLKAPLISDVQYGGHYFYLSKIKRKYNLKKFTEEEPLVKRAALHAFSITVKGMKEEEIHVEADYPKDLRALLSQLENYDA